MVPLKPAELQQLVLWIERRPSASTSQLLVGLVRACWPNGLSG
jgi:hypothetical protein